MPRDAVVIPESPPAARKPQDGNPSLMGGNADVGGGGQAERSEDPIQDCRAKPAPRALSSATHLDCGLRHHLPTGSEHIV